MGSMSGGAFGALLCVAVVFLGSALAIHLRGRDRFSLTRALNPAALLGPYNVLMYLFSAVRPRPFVPVAHFPELAPLRENWQTIRDEGLALYHSDRIRKADKHDDISFNTFFKRGWTRFYLKWYDDFLPSAKSGCPESVRLVRSIPTVNAAMFAILPPHAKLGRHRDPFAGSLRYHLGLATPNAEACHIVVDGQPYSWRDGEDVMFDETFIHSAQNGTDQPRLILFCDINRPLRTPLLRAVNRFVTRRLAKISAAGNTVGDKIGFLNRISPLIHLHRQLITRFKARSRRLYYLSKWMTITVLIYLACLVLALMV